MSSYNEQSGSVWSIEVFLASSVTGWQPRMSDENASLLVFPSPPINLQLEPANVNVRENDDAGTNGAMQSVTISFNTIGLSKEVQQEVDKINHKLVVVRTTDLEGVKKVYGTNVTPLTFNAQIVLGTTQEQGQGYQISCSGTTLTRGVYV